MIFTEGFNLGLTTRTNVGDAPHFRIIEDGDYVQIKRNNRYIWVKVLLWDTDEMFYGEIAITESCVNLPDIAIDNPIGTKIHWHKKSVILVLDEDDGKTWGSDGISRVYEGKTKNPLTGENEFYNYL